jgi:hypothetical protein
LTCGTPEAAGRYRGQQSDSNLFRSELVLSPEPDFPIPIAFFILFANVLAASILGFLICICAHSS